MKYQDFFVAATGHTSGPFDYQVRLAGGDAGRACESLQISIPTGLGKTAAVVLAWLWNRVALRSPAWPRRLVYCLPMRTLVEQTRDEVEKWLRNLNDQAASLGLDAESKRDLEWLLTHSPVILMGGEEPDAARAEWDIYPERPCVLVGTQDMLLSRALNRGYGMSRYRWPMHFGLLNNDCLWVMDETQLMGAGLATACQLEAFRQQRGPGLTSRFGSYPDGRSITWYSSATAAPAHLEIRDWRGVERAGSFLFALSETETSASIGPVAERWLATKRLELRDAANFGDKHKAPAKEIIAELLLSHRSMLIKLKDAPAELPRRTLTICNRVDRAVAVHELLKEQLAGCRDIDLVLTHSRFRPTERKEQAPRLRTPDLKRHPGGQIIVATQVIEAGADVSSAILWTEIAPLACLVQRFGRLNRAGEFGFGNNSLHGFTPQAIVVGIETPDPESGDFKNKEQKDKARKEADLKHLPYTKSKCDDARATLGRLKGSVSPAVLAEVKGEVSASIERCPYSLQQHELLDFFDTDANLSLGFTDVSPFVRGIDPETDFYVAWRDWPGSNDGACPNLSADFQRQELCPVPIGKARDAGAVLSKGWVWRGKEAGWSPVRNLEVVPGMTILLPVTAGGYRADSGWTGRADDVPVVSVYEPGDTASDEEMLSSLRNGWRNIAQHADELTHEWERIAGALAGLQLSSKEQASIVVAGHWHDIGKNHPRWQAAAEKALADAGISLSNSVRPIAKFCLSACPRLAGLTGDALKRELRVLRQSFKPGLAHEVASALALRQSEEVEQGGQRSIESLLSEYLVMSHHGRVRKVLRDEMPRHPTCQRDTETVRGVANGDLLPPVVIAGQQFQGASLSTDCRRMGRDAQGNESYTRGVLRLLEYYGPFRLAFLETLFRAADIRASILAGKADLGHVSLNELDGDRPQMACLAAGAEATAPLGSYSCGCGSEYALREGASVGNDDSRDTRPDRATRFIQTTYGVLSYTELAPLLAERVARLETEVYSGIFANRTLDDAELILDMHRSICADLVPEWAGRWRNIAVAVGRMSPPPPHQVPMLMRDYGLDLQARWQGAVDSLSELTIEFLAFAEGRFLTIHPFQDFNGRTIRVFLLELLRRLDLPRVELAPQTASGRAEYFAALETADQRDWRPLVAIWRDRLANSHSTP